MKRFPFIYWIYKFVLYLRRYHEFRKAFQDFKALDNGNRFPVRWEDRYPCLNEKTTTTSFDRHYIYHTAWACRILRRNKPRVHVDISSALYFVTTVSAFIPVCYIEYRPPNLDLSGLYPLHANLNSLPFPNESIVSLSCMHVVEHIGLGRYGDPIDPYADMKSIAELIRVLSKKGNLLFVTPIGKPKIMFNAHRIYSYDQIMEYFADLKLLEFALIPEKANGNGLLYDAPKQLIDAQNYGCGCFWFRKS